MPSPKAKIKELQHAAMERVLQVLEPSSRVIAEELLQLAMRKHLDPDIKRRALVDILNIFDDYSKEPMGPMLAPQIQIINHIPLPGIVSEPTLPVAVVDGVPQDLTPTQKKE